MAAVGQNPAKRKRKMLTKEVKRAIRYIVKNAETRWTKANRLHREINYRGKLEADVARYAKNGVIGIRWSGTSYCDGVYHHESHTNYLAPRNWREAEALIERSDPSIEGPCGMAWAAPVEGGRVY
jgi:hypothetical protein